MKKNICYLVTMVVTLSLFVTTAAYAISIEEAKSKGLVGEMQTGYIGAISSPSAEVQAFLEQINKERRAKYFEIAQKNGTPLAAVEALAAKKAIDQTASGNSIQLPSGAWVKKK